MLNDIVIQRNNHQSTASQTFCLHLVSSTHRHGGNPTQLCIYNLNYNFLDIIIEDVDKLEAWM
jgi:hypothetical protein